MANSESILKEDIWTLYSSGYTYEKIAHHLNIREKFVKRVILNIIEAENNIVKKLDNELSLIEKAFCINRKITPPFVLMTDNKEVKALARKLNMI